MIPEPLRKFIELFAKLPGIGPRQGSRIGFWLARQPEETLRVYQHALEDIRTRIGICSQCFFVFEPERNERANTPSEGEGAAFCHICRDPRRDASVIAVVEKETDLITIEKSKRFRGLYYVLGGTFSPLGEPNGNVRAKELIERIKNAKTPFQEIILALSPTSEGDFTSLELEKMLAPLAVKITRLGRGLPRGAEVEFADEDTIAGALEGRK